MGIISSISRGSDVPLKEVVLADPKPSKLASAPVKDRFESPLALTATESPVEISDAFHFQDACKQYLIDNDALPKPGLVAQIFARILGKGFMRCFSNLAACLGMSGFYKGRREYPILAPHTVLRTSDNQPLVVQGKTMTAADLAQRYKPVLATINQELPLSQTLVPKDMRYEVLPPKEGKNHYSIVYYVCRESERLPIPVLGRLYNWVRPILYGTAQDWEPIQIDISRDTGEPVGMSYESCNYTGDPSSFDATNSVDLHLLTKLAKTPQGIWTHTLYQKNGMTRSLEIESPFGKDSRPRLGFVSWNGSYDVLPALAKRGYSETPSEQGKKIYALKEAPLSFMDAQTFCNEGMDLRAGWLDLRKQGRCVMQMPARKSMSEVARGFFARRLPS